MVEAAALLLKNQISKLIIMRYWPVPNSYSKNIPNKNSPGSFWENRKDRFHCGIDIYAPAESEVISIDNGTVIDTGIFTTPDKISYWNKTKYVLIKNQDGFICKYAELSDITVKTNELVKERQTIGYVGTVLNVDKITEDAPRYILDMKNNNVASMLHFEVYTSKPRKTKKCLGGNWFGSKKPRNLINPTLFLLSTIRNSSHSGNLE